MNACVKTKLVYSTVKKKAIVLTNLSKYRKAKRPRIKAGTYIKVFGRLIDVSNMPSSLKH